MSVIQAVNIKIPKPPKTIPKRAHFLFLTFRTLMIPIIKAAKEIAAPISTDNVPALAIPKTNIVPNPTIPNIPEVFAIFWWFGSFSLMTESSLTI